MSDRPRFSVRLLSVALGLLALTLPLAAGVLAATPVSISTDLYTNTTSQHRTEVEPDSFANGSTVVTAFQVGRFTDGGSSNIGWATSTNGGSTWTNGFLPGITKIANGANPYDRVSDPAVAYDAKHNTWLISSLGLSGSNILGAAVLVNRSTDGGLTWGNPVAVATATGTQDFDKNWIVCDNAATSPFYGNCYVEFDDFGNGNQLKMYRSLDGGQSWTPGTVPSVAVLGGQPVVQPNGTVVMPVPNANVTRLLSIKSTDGGATWTNAATIASISDHATAGGLRSDALPTAEVDSAGKVYVVWQDCRYRRGCASNDLVMSTSTDGTTWTAPARIPIDAVSSSVDHFIPGLAVDRSTSGTAPKLALTYYYYPKTKCNASTCQLYVGFTSSSDGGAHWTQPTTLAGPMSLSWLPSTTQGRMVGDYISTSFANGTAVPAFSVADAPSGSTFNQYIATSTGLSTSSAVLISAGTERPVPNAAADHAAPSSPIRRR